MSQQIGKMLARSIAVGILVGLLVTAAVAESFETPSSPSQPGSRSTTNQTPARQPSAAKTPAKTPPVLLTPERETVALQFVHEHHPELVDLLKALKTSHPNQYHTAITQLFQTSERLARIHEIDPQRYEVELKLWKIKSRIQLLVARSSMSRDMEFDSQLKTALAEQAQVQLQEMQMDRDRAAERLKNLDRMVDKFQTNQQTTIDKQYKMLVREIDRQRAQAEKQLAAAKLAAAKKAKQANHAQPADSSSADSSNADSSQQSPSKSTDDSNPASATRASKKSNAPNKPVVPPAVPPTDKTSD